MHRRPVRLLLARYRAAFRDEAAVVDRMATLVAMRADCLQRTCLPGHVTASAFVVDAEGRRFLLTHHRKLGRWLQLGGHVDGEPDVLQAALREAREESGMQHFTVLPVRGVEGMPLDLDVHVIPAREHEPEHEHHDVRFLLRAEPGQDLVRSAESHDLRWFDLADLERVVDEESLLRLGRKVRAVLAGE